MLERVVQPGVGLGSMSDGQKSLFSSLVNIGAMVGCILCLVRALHRVATQ
jgi:hypothetical protein